MHYRLQKHSVLLVRQTEGDVIAADIDSVGMQQVFVNLLNNAIEINDAFFTTKENGLGLGLAICRDVMETHHGQIQLQSIKPHGCMVTLSLPYF